MMAAGTAARAGAQVLLLEKNRLLGKKLLITGKGRCNLTNACEIEEVIARFGAQGKFLYSSLHRFPPTATQSFLLRGDWSWWWSGAKDISRIWAIK